MTWFEEVKPFFLLTRAYGLAPYSYHTGVPSESLPWRIYAYISLVARIFDSLALPFVLTDKSHEVKFSLKMMELLESMIAACSFIIEGFVSTYCFNELKIMIDLIADFDRTLRIDFATTSLAIRSWLVLALIAVYGGCKWTLQFASSNTFYAMISCYYIVKNLGGFAMVFKFTAIVNSIERRFQHLYGLIIADTTGIVYEMDGSEGPLRLRDVGRLHGNLVTAAKKLNSIHNMVLFMWIGDTVFYGTTNMYELLMMDPAASGFRKTLPPILYMMVNMILLVHIIASCNGACEAANKIGHAALSPKSSVLRGRFFHERDDGYLIGQHFIMNPLNFTAAYGLINVELPFLGTIFGAMTTFLVILTNY